MLVDSHSFPACSHSSHTSHMYTRTLPYKQRSLAYIVADEDDSEAAAAPAKSESSSGDLSSATDSKGAGTKAPESDASYYSTSGDGTDAVSEVSYYSGSYYSTESA